MHSLYFGSDWQRFLTPPKEINPHSDCHEIMKGYGSYLFISLLSLLSLAFSCDKSEVIIEEGNRGSIMIVPDIQNYTDNEDRLKYLDSIVSYYKQNQNMIDAVFQVGDITNQNQLWQYENAYHHFFSMFCDDEQLVYCLGNHDYGNGGSSDVRMSNCPDYMMPPYDLRMEGTQYENYVRYLTIGGNQYAVLVLEFCSRNIVLDWANKVIQNDASIPFILVTHAFLNNCGQLFDQTDPNCASGGSPKNYQMSDDYRNDSKEIFDKIIYNNPNVKLVICGHSLTPDYINAMSLKNQKGEKVGFVMVNFQHYPEGGRGIVGILSIYDDHYVIRSYSTFDKNKGKIEISF